VHVLTEKGKGYAPAEKNPSKFHGISPFDIETGETIEVKVKDTYTDVFGKVMCKVGEQNDKVVAITAAMKDGTGLVHFGRKYPDRFFDVGIAEEHAVTFAAGLAAAGLKPVFAVYSAFLQRGYDQIVHDVCMQNLPVVFAIDRAGLVGSDGETHQGAYDIAYLNHIPNMTLLSPKNKWELADMLRFAADHPGPIALRYPRGTAYDGMKEYRTPIELGKSEVIYEGEDIAILSVGHMMEVAQDVYHKLKVQGYNCSLINARFVKPMDEAMLTKMAENHKLFVTIEDGIRAGGYGEKVETFVYRNELPVKVLVNAIPDQYVEQGSISQLRKEIGLDAESIVEKVIANRR
jgi:1-deoxy-D-xylulose-5-phosphate synthase